MKNPLKALNPTHLKRYRAFSRLLVKHGRRDLSDRLGLSDYLREGDVHETTHARAEQLAADLESLGPAFIKLGQLLSTRADMLPLEYLEALSRLQDSVAPFAYEDVVAIVERELGTTIKHAFGVFEPTPIASASLGQVHRGVLPSGRLVAVKVQRPGIREDIIRDFEALAPIADFMDEHTEMGAKYEFAPLLRDLRSNLMHELDYKEEARNLVTMAANLSNRDRIIVPLPVSEYTTSRVLTMDYVRGKKITSLSPLVQQEIHGDELITELFNAYLDQVLVHGFFHADPHPGNVFLTENYHSLALIDLGLICQVTPAASEKILKLLLALSDGDGEEAAEFALSLSNKKPGFNRDKFTESMVEIALQARSAGMGEHKFGTIFLLMQQAAAENGVRLARELRYLGKTILNLETIGEVLADRFKPQVAISRHASQVMRRRMYHSLKPSRMLKQTAELKEVIELLPRRVNQIMELITRNEIRLNIDAIDEDRLMVGFQKVANRITVGLVLAAMIVGASLMMDNDAPFKLMGYPGIAILLLMFSILIGGFLVVNIVWNDIYGRRKKK